MMKFMCIFIFSIRIIFANDLPSCESSNIYFKTYVEQKTRVKGKVVSTQLLVDLNSEWSIHAGRFNELVIVSSQNLSEAKILFNYVTYKNTKLSKEISIYKKNKMYISVNNRINDFMNSWIANGPGSIQAILYSNKKSVCDFRIDVVRGD